MELHPLSPARGTQGTRIVRVFWLPFLPTFRAFPEKNLQWLLADFVHGYRCGAATAFHRFPLTIRSVYICYEAGTHVTGAGFSCQRLCAEVVDSVTFADSSLKTLRPDHAWGQGVTAAIACPSVRRQTRSIPLKKTSRVAGTRCPENATKGAKHHIRSRSWKDRWRAPSCTAVPSMEAGHGIRLPAPSVFFGVGISLTS